MTDLTTTETILPPIGQHVGQLTRDLIARKGNGTEERARTKIGARGSVSVTRSDEGIMHLHCNDGYGGGSLMVRGPEDARAFAEALTAFADAVEEK